MLADRAVLDGAEEATSRASRFRAGAGEVAALAVAEEPNDDMGPEARSVESGFSSPLSSVDGEYEGRRKLYALA